MNKLPKVTLLVLVLVLTGLIMPACSTQGTEGDNMAPDFLLDDMEGKPISLSDFRGKPVMLNFWATWCRPCVYEMPLLQQVYEEWSAKGLVLLTINVGESPAQVENFLQWHNISFPVLFDTNREVASRYNIRYLPTTLFIDKDGIAHAMKYGPFLEEEEIEDYLSKIMP